jgi:hypothetical protein
MGLLAGPIKDVFSATESLEGDPPAPPAHPTPIARLGTHLDIGWDFDGTLVGHPASPILHEFIRSRRAVRHVIVTFRTGSEAARIWNDLARYGTAPDRWCFDQVLSIPNAAIGEYAANRQRPGFMRHLLSSSRAEQQCRHWKGQVCSEHNLTALVDDMTGFVAAGCRRYDVALFHPSAFLAAGKTVLNFTLPMWRSMFAVRSKLAEGAPLST